MSEIGYIGQEYVRKYIKPRDPDTHKGECGRILVIAGSRGMAGAAVLCARAALRSGAGLVTVAVPEELFPILQTAVPEAMCIVRERLNGDGAKDLLEPFDAIAIGPGLRIREENLKLIKRILELTSCQIVIDADGLNTLATFRGGMELFRKQGYRIVLTPHPGEADRLLGSLDAGTVKELGRERAVRVLADRTGATVLLKGNRTLVTQVQDGISCNTTGNPGMATGGSGDALTGVIAALLAWGYNGGVAARTGAYIHGLAGDLAANEIGQWGMTASDLVEYLPKAFRQIAGI